MPTDTGFFTFLKHTTAPAAAILALGLTLWGCSGGMATYTDTSAKKDPVSDSKLLLKIKHFSEDSSLVLAALRSDDIYFAPTQSSQTLWCKFNCSVKVTDNAGIPVRTAEKNFSLQRDKVKKYAVFGIKIPLGQGSHGLEFSATDINSNRTFRTGTLTFKNAENTGKTLTIAEDDVLIAYPHCPIGTEVTISADVPEINVTYFNQIPLPPAPFSTEKPSLPEKWKSDTAGKLAISNGVTKLSLGAKGLFVFENPETNEVSEAVLATSPHYPDVRKIEELIFSARYIMTKAEYEEIISSKDVKKKFDSFWITNAGSKEKARSMIRTYYNRVITANTLFTCHKEGWQTDRGMIFIVLGPPVTIFSDSEKEVWTYPRSGLPGNDEFRFLKTRPNFDNNYYELVRSPEYKPIWMANVESWRTGRTN